MKVYIVYNVCRLHFYAFIILFILQTDLVLWLLTSLLVPALALQLSNAPHSKPMITLNREHEIKSEETCNICIEFADEAIQILLQLIVGKRAWLHVYDVMPHPVSPHVS